MCLRLLYTDSLGRDPVPAILRRILAFLFNRGSLLDMGRLLLSCSGLSFLPPHAFGGVFDSLALVGLRRAKRTNLPCGRAQHLAIGGSKREPKRRQSILAARCLIHFRSDALG